MAHTRFMLDKKGYTLARDGNRTAIHLVALYVCLAILPVGLWTDLLKQDRTSVSPTQMLVWTDA